MITYLTTQQTAYMMCYNYLLYYMYWCIKNHGIIPNRNLFTSLTSCLQMRSKPIMKRIPAHYYNPPGISIWRHRHKFEKCQPPQILMYGDSHLANLRKWEHVKPNRDGPRPLDKLVLKRLKHCSVGGSTFGNIHNRVRNIIVPKSQPDRGNQWQAVLDDKTCNPTYIYISLGSNDCDSFGQRLSWLTNRQLVACQYPDAYGTCMIRFDPISYYHQ